MSKDVHILKCDYFPKSFYTDKLLLDTVPVIVNWSARFPIPYKTLNIIDLFSIYQPEMIILCISLVTTSEVEHLVLMILFLLLSVLCIYVFLPIFFLSLCKIPYALRRLNLCFILQMFFQFVICLLTFLHNVFCSIEVLYFESVLLVLYDV